MIINFHNKLTKSIFNGDKIKRIDKNLIEKIRRRLELLNAAKNIEDLYFPPSNKFHKLQGYKPIRYAISINIQWRISFEWHEGNVYDAYYEDYH